MKKIILLLILPFSLFASHLGKRGAEASSLEDYGSKRQELTECPFGVTKIIFATSGESAGTLPEEMTDQASIKRLCEISEVIGTACRFAQSQKNNEIEISDFPKHLFETLLEIDQTPNQLELILQSANYYETNVSELLFLCYYFKVNSEAVKAIATYIANHENLFLAYLEFIRDLPNQDLFEYLINNLNINDLERSDYLFSKESILGKFDEFLVTPDNKHIVAVDRNRNNNLAIIDLNNLNNIIYVQGNYYKFLVTPDSNYIVAKNNNNNLVIIDLNNLNNIIYVQGNFDEFLVTPDSNYIVAKNNNNNLVIIDLNNLNNIRSVQGDYYKFLVTPDSKYVIASDRNRNNDLTIIDLNNLKNIIHVTSILFNFLVTSDNKYLVIVNENYKLVIIDLNNLNNIRYVQGIYNNFSVTPDSKYVIANDDDEQNNDLAIIDLNNLNNIIYVPGNYYNFSVTPDSKYVIASDESEQNKDLTIINLNNLNDIRSVQGDYYKFFVTPDSKYVIAFDKNIRSNKSVIIDLNNFNIRDVLGCYHKFFVTPDGKYIVASHNKNNDLVIINLNNFDIRYVPVGFSIDSYVTLKNDYLIVEYLGHLMRIDLNNLSKKLIAKISRDSRCAQVLGHSILCKEPSVGILLFTPTPKFLDFIRDSYKNDFIFNKNILSQIIKSSDKYENFFSQDLVDELKTQLQSLT